MSDGSPGFEVASITQPNPDRDGTSEDALCVLELEGGELIVAVADGFGGAPSGERAAAIAVDQLESNTKTRSGSGGLRAAVLDAFELANRAILDLGIGAATTLAVLTLEDELARPFHAGDSCILIVGGRGKLKWKNVGHSPAGYAVASGWIDPAEARRHEEAQVVSNYLGHSEMAIDVGPEIELATRDVVLVASDGLTDNVDLPSICAELSEAGSLRSRLEALAALAESAMRSPSGKPDDLTMVAVRRRPQTR